MQYCFCHPLHKFETTDLYCNNARTVQGTNSLSHRECCGCQLKSHLVKNAYTHILSIIDSFALKNVILLLFAVKMFSVHNYLSLSSLLVYLFVCFSIIMCSCNLPLILCCVCPLCSYVCLYCAVSVIGLVAVDSAHK
jgi:hypothetical protein